MVIEKLTEGVVQVVERAEKQAEIVGEVVMAEVIEVEREAVWILDVKSCEY